MTRSASSAYSASATMPSGAEIPFREAVVFKSCILKFEYGINIVHC